VAADWRYPQETNLNFTPQPIYNLLIFKTALLPALTTVSAVGRSRGELDQDTCVTVTARAKTEPEQEQLEPGSWTALAAPGCEASSSSDDATTEQGDNDHPGGAGLRGAVNEMLEVWDSSSRQRKSAGTLKGRGGLFALHYPKRLKFQVRFMGWSRRERTCQMWRFSSCLDSEGTSAAEERARSSQRYHQISGLANRRTLQQSHPHLPPWLPRSGSVFQSKLWPLSTTTAWRALLLLTRRTKPKPAKGKSPAAARRAHFDMSRAPGEGGKRSASPRTRSMASTWLHPLPREETQRGSVSNDAGR